MHTRCRRGGRLRLASIWTGLPDSSFIPDPASLSPHYTMDRNMESKPRAGLAKLGKGNSMGSLSIALLNSAQAQRTFSRALSVIQTNVSNVNAPGYATQTPQFLNQPFNPDIGLPGGVAFGQLQDSRSI